LNEILIGGGVKIRFAYFYCGSNSWGPEVVMITTFYGVMDQAPSSGQNG
jgi:hypothetical protein